MSAIQITGQEVFKSLAKLGSRVVAGNKNAFHQGKDKTFKTLVGNMTRIDTGSLLSSAKAESLPDGFWIGVGAGKNSKRNVSVAQYSIPQDLGFQHYRNGFIKGTNASKLAVDTHMEKIMESLNAVVYTEIMRSMLGAR